MSGSPGSAWDLITVSGSATISATAGNPFTIYLSGNPAGWDPSLSNPSGWNIIQWGSVTGFDPGAFVLNASFFTGTTPTGTWAFSNSSGYLNLSYEAPGGAIVWTAGGGNWSVGGNWQSGSVPPNGSPLEFAGAGGVSTNNGALTAINGLIFSSSAGGSYTINGTSLEIGGGGVSNASIHNQTVALDLILTAAQAFDSGSSNLTISGAIANSNQRLTTSGNGTITLSGALSGTGGLTKTDSGTLILTANNTYSGTTILSGGTIRVEGAGLLGGGNYSATVSNSGTLLLNSSSNQILSGSISGNGSLVKNNSSSLTLSGSNTHSGGTTLNAGTLRINNASALGSGGFIIGGGTTIDNTSGSSLVLSTNNTQNWNGDFTFTGSNNLDLGTGAVAMNATRTITVTANTLTVGGVVSGSGHGLAKNGAGTLVLSGNNTYTGTTTINSGTLLLAGNNAYSGATVISTGTLWLDTNGRLGGGSYAGNITNNGVFRFASSVNQTLSGNLSGSGALVKEGTGLLTLSGVSTYSGGTTISAGRLVGNLNSLQGAITNNSELEFSMIDSGTYSTALTGSGALIKSGAGTLVLSGNNTYSGITTVSSGTLTIGSTGRLGGGAYSSNISNAGTLILGSNSNQTLSGVISGAGALVKEGSGSLTLSGTNTFTGGVTILSGTLQVGTNNSLGSTTGITLDGGSFAMTSAFISNRSVILGSSGGMLDFRAAGNTAATGWSAPISGNGTLTIAANGDVNSATGGRLDLTGGNTFTGTITIISGVVAPSANAFGSASNIIVLNGGGLLATANITISNNIVLGSSGGTFRVYGPPANPTMTINGSISGSGKLDITDNGPVTLARANTFTGDTRLMNATLTSQTTLNLAHVDALSGSTLDLNAADRGVVNFTVAGNNTYNLGGLKGSRNITSLGGNTISIGGNSQNTTYSGSIAGGTGGLTKAGNGTLTLTGANTYTGTTTVNSGTLELGHATNTLPDTGGVTINGGVLSIGSNNDTVGAFTLAGGALIGTTGTLSASSFNLQNGTVSAILGGAGAVTKNDSGTLTLTNANSYSGGTTLNAGTLVIGNTAAVGSGLITQTSGSSLLVFDTTGTISNAMSIYNVRASQTVTLSGGITVNNATFDVEDGEMLTVSNTINGTGGVTKNGAGTLVLGGSNTYSGATVVNAGVLQTENAAALGSNTTVTVNGGSLLVSSNGSINDKSITLNKTISGSASAAQASLFFDSAYSNTSGSLGALTLHRDSIIDLGTEGVVVHFASIANINDYILHIFNWQGDTVWSGSPGGGKDQFYVHQALGTDALNNIRFYSGITESSFLSTGFQIMSGGFQNEIIAVPEPETWATGALLLLWAAFWARRKYHRSQKAT